MEIIPFNSDGVVFTKHGKRNMFKKPVYLFFDKVGVVDVTNDIMYRSKDFRLYMQDLIDISKARIKRIEERKKEALNTPPYFLNEITIKFLDGAIEDAKEEIKDAKFNLTRFNKSVMNRRDDLASVKMTPITNFLQFDNGNFTKCVYHNEKSGSLKYYPDTNTVYCFGCGQAGDVISVVMAKYNCDFKEALSIIKSN